nr:uncharacterized protein LOC117279952 [Nicotiana tomentosiformis]
MVNVSSSSRGVPDPVPLVVCMPSHEGGAAIAAKDESFPTVEEINPRSEKARTDVSKLPEDDREAVESEMGTVSLSNFRVKFKIPVHIDLVPAGRDVVQIHRPGYCMFYTYPFYVGYSFPILPLVEKFCRYYGVFPAQLSPYIYKLILMLTKYAELADRGVTLHHLMHLLALSFHIGTMLHLHHHRGKSLVVKMDDKANRRFWFNYVYVKTEDMVANANGFPEAWNYAPETAPPPLVADIHEWVSQILPHTVGIRGWPAFFQKFRPKLSATGRGSSKRQKAPAPAFHKRKAISVPTVVVRPARSSTTAAGVSTSPMRLVDEDDEEGLSPTDDNLLPRKRGFVGIGEESVRVGSSVMDGIVIRETTTIDLGVSTELLSTIPPPSGDEGCTLLLEARTSVEGSSM